MFIQRHASVHSMTRYFSNGASFENVSLAPAESDCSCRSWNRHSIWCLRNETIVRATNLKWLIYGTVNVEVRTGHTALQCRYRVLARWRKNHAIVTLTYRPAIASDRRWLPSQSGRLMSDGHIRKKQPTPWHYQSRCGSCSWCCSGEWRSSLEVAPHSAVAFDVAAQSDSWAAAAAEAACLRFWSSSSLNLCHQQEKC